MTTQQDTVLRLHGELDDDGCDAVRRMLAPWVAKGLQHLVLDLSAVTAVPLPGVRLLRSLDRHLRAQQGGLVVTHPSEAARTALRVNELEHLLEIRDLEPFPRRVPPRKPQEGLAGVVPLVRRA